MSGKSAAVRKFLEQLVVPKQYRSDVDTVTLQERGKQNPAALSAAEQDALKTTPPAADPAAQAQPGVDPAAQAQPGADPAAQAAPGATPANVDAPTSMPPGVFEQTRQGLEGDMFRDPMPGAPPDIPQTAGRDLEHRTTERNINLDRVRTPDDIKALIDETARVTGPEDTTTHKAISAKAGRVDVLDLLANGKPDDAWNPQQLLATRRLMVAEAERLHEKAVELAEQHALSPRSVTPADWAEFANMKNRYSALQKVVQGKTRIAAQTLNSLAITAGPTARAARLQEMDELVGRVGGPEELARQAQMLAGLDPADPKTAGKFGDAASKLSGAREVAFSVWINGLLSSPPTHFVNVLSNTITNMYEGVLINPLGGLIGEARGAFGATDRMYAGENIARFAGTVSGTIDGIVTGASRALGPRGVQGIGKGSKVDVREYVVDTGDPVADYLADMALQGPSRFLDGEDQFFKVLAYRQELNAQAYRRAAKEGLRGEAFQKRIHELVNNPDEPMHLASLEYSEELTFTNRPHDDTLFGALAQAGSKVRQMYPLSTLVIPFIRTPANIADYAVKNLPGANTWQIVKDIKAGGAKADQAMARAAVSWTALWAVWEAVEDGRITGSGPTNPRLWRVYEQSGYKPQSIRVGDKWHQYDRLDPMGLVVNVLADFAEVARHSKDPDNMTMGVMTAMLGFAENLTDSTYLRGVSDLLDIIRSDDAAAVQGVQWLGRMGGSMMPYSAMGGYIARSEDVDPETGRANVRSAPRPSMTGESPVWTTILNNMATRSPLHRPDLPMTIDWKGEPARRDYGGYLDEAFPVKYAEVRKDRVAAALWENRVPVNPPTPLLRWTFPLGREYMGPEGLPMPTTINLLDLDGGRGEVLEEYQKRVGKARYNELQVALLTLGYDKLPAEAKGSNTHTADSLSAASSKGTTAGTEDFALWYLSVAKDKGWPIPGSPEWDEIAAAQRPLVSNEANPDAPTQPAPPGALRF